MDADMSTDYGMQWKRKSPNASESSAFGMHFCKFIWNFN